jgi:acetyl esterase/lipase
VATTLAIVLLLRPPSAIGLSLGLAVPRSEAWLVPLSDSFHVEELTVSGEDRRRLVADLYRPPQPRAGLLLVHGLSRAGRRHPELVRLAQLLARQGTLVLVPHFEGLAAFQLSGQEVADIGAALGALRERTPRVGVAGFSFGAGPALIAAASHRDLVLTGSFGGYADLRAVIGFLTTGVHEHAGVRYTRPPEEYNRWKLLALLVGVVGDAADRQRLGEIAQRKLADPGEDTRSLEVGAGPEAQAVLALVTNRREETIAPLLGALSPTARAAIDALSPLTAVPRLPGRLVIAHGADDASIPFTESLRLAHAAGGRAQLVILESFDHTRPRPLLQSIGTHTRDILRLLRLASALLRTD